MEPGFNDNRQEAEVSIDDISFEIVERSEKTEKEVMDLLHEYPDHFIKGQFEKYIKEDFENSYIAIAYVGGKSVGCLTYKPENNEFIWLATRKVEGVRKRDIGKKLFETFYPIIEDGQEVQMFVNTEDSSVEGHSNFSGANFKAARSLYVDHMGLELGERLDDYYGPGQHVYRIAWVPNKKED